MRAAPFHSGFVRRDFDRPSPSGAVCLRSVPSVTSLGMNPCMTAMAQRDQVASVVCSSLCKRNLVVNFFHRNNHTLLVAQFTERMCLDIRITDAFPGTSVPSLHCRVSSILLIRLVVLLGVFLTETVLRQLWTAGIMTWVFWFSWHPVTSMHNKSHKGISSSEASSFSFTF